LIGSEILLTIAELSVAFAGFSSIVVLFQHRDPANWPAAVPVRLRAMVESSFATLYGSLLPLVLHHLGLEGPSLWAVSSGFVSLVLLGVGFSFYRRAQPHLPTGDLSRKFTFTLTIVTVPIVALQLLNTTGLLFTPRFGPYLLAVVWSLVVASLIFLRMVVSPISGKS
jgi:hypothetical protein